MVVAMMAVVVMAVVIMTVVMDGGHDDGSLG